MMSLKTTHAVDVSIGYLDRVEAESGRVAKQGDGYHIAGRFVPRVPTRAVEPTIVSVEVSDDRIATIQPSWGDRVARNKTPCVYGTLTNGTSWELGEDDALRLGGYVETVEPLLAAIRDAHRQVADAWRAAIASRPDVAAVVEDYRATVLDRLDREYAAHLAQWETDTAAIARKFRRQWVQVGEQTVPGKCCVRGAKGTLLGYANVWDGRWLGTVERI